MERKKELGVLEEAADLQAQMSSHRRWLTTLAARHPFLSAPCVEQVASGYLLPPGWRSLVGQCVEEMAKWSGEDRLLQVVQLKVKFGGLRIRLLGASDLQRGIAYGIEAVASCSCAECGRPCPPADSPQLPSCSEHENQTYRANEL